MRVLFGSVEFRLSAVTVVQCFVGAASWLACGSSEELAEFTQFSDAFFPYLLPSPTTGTS